MKSAAWCFVILAAAAGVAATAVVSAPQEMVEEGSTGVQFPKTVSFAGADTTYQLELTGLALRKKLWIKVYAMAHYMGGGEIYDSDADALTVALGDQYAKQITLAFVRGVGAGKIQGAFREGFEKNASGTEMAEISDLVDRFVGFFTQEAEKGERMVFRAAPGGEVTTVVGGEEQEPIRSVTFSRVLWRIWLGEHSIVDRDHLVEMVVQD